MTDEANDVITGAPGTIELGGKTYLVGQPDDQVFATLKGYLAERLQSPFQAIADDLKFLSAADREAAIRAAVALKAGGGVDVTQAFADKQLRQPHGCAFLAWLLIRKEQPEAKLEDIHKAVTQDAVIDVLAKLYTAAGMDSLGKAGGRNSSRSG
jgi:hypothetical protein